MMNETKTQAALGIARQELKDTLERVKELRVKIANLRLDVAAERAERKVARAEKRAAKIAAMEARVAEMRLKANAPKQIRKNYRKASPVKVWTAEEIAALNS